MPEFLTITLDGSINDNAGRIDIEIDNFTSNPNDAQDITFVDGGDFTAVVNDSEYFPNLRLENMGFNDNAPDVFRFDLASFNESFDISITSEGPEDTFVIAGATGFSESSGVFTINYQGSDGSNYVVRLNPGDAAVSFVCFVPGTLIETPEGPVDVIDLKPGDLVVTRDSGPQPIRHILRRTAEFRDRESVHKPILLSRGCLGPNLPQEDLAVSPQHRVLLSGHTCEVMFGAKEVLAPAKGLLDLPGVRQKKGVKSVDYIALVLDRHEIVTAAHYPCETLLVAPYTVATLPQQHRDALGDDLPVLEHAHIRPARDLLTVRQTKAWVDAVRQLAKDAVAQSAA